MLRWSIAGCVPSPAHVVKLASALDALTSAYDARRHGTRCGVQLLCVVWLKEIGRRQGSRGRQELVGAIGARLMATR